MFWKKSTYSNHSSIRRFFFLTTLILLSFSAFQLFSPWVALWNNDLLNQVFDESKRYDTVINPGNSKDAVGWQVFNKTTQVDINLVGWGKVIQSQSQEPYLVRLTKLILRISIAAAVPIIIWSGIMYMTAFGDANKQKKAQNIAIYALLWIFLGLSSLAIIELVLSITKNSLAF